MVAPVARRLLRGLAIAAALTAAAAAPAQADTLAAPDLTTPAAGATLKANPAFAWAPVARAAGYRIEVATTANGFSTPVYKADVFGGAAVPVDELPLGSLYWRVATLDWTGTLGPFTAARTLTRAQADAPQLSGPANGAQLAYPSDPAVLSWQPVAGAQSYSIEVDDEDSFTAPVTSYTTQGTSFALPAALPSGIPRYWRVQAVSTNPSVTTAWSNVADPRSFSVAWPAATKPSLVAPADDATVGLDAVEFSWSPVAGAAKYEIEISTAPTFTPASTTSKVTGATRYSPVATLSEDQYFWRVRALASNGGTGFNSSSWSTPSTFKRLWRYANGGGQVRPTLTIPDADGSAINGSQLEQDQISIRWDAAPRASYYELQVSTDSNFSDLLTKTCKTPNTEWTPYLSGAYNGTVPGPSGACAWTAVPATDGFLQPGPVYYARVRAVERSTDGRTLNSLWSDTAREGENAPPAPVSFTVVAPTRSGTVATKPAEPLSSPPISDGTPKLTWKPVTGATTYRVLMARDQSFNTRVLDYAETTNTEFVLNQVLLDNAVAQSYFWIVLPCTNSGCVGTSQAINISPYYASFRKLGSAVGGTNSAAVQTDTVAVSWQDHYLTSPTGGGMDSYRVEIIDSGGAVAKSVLTDTTSYTPIDDSLPDGQYTWRVQAVDAAGNGLPFSTPIGFEKRSSVPVPQTPAPSSTLPVLTWTPTAYANSYDVEVYKGTDPAFPLGSKVASASVTGRRYPSYTPSGALAADTYSWRVRQVDAYGRTGPWSTDVKPFTVGGTAPVPATPAAGAGAPLPTLQFSWAAVPGAVRYRVETAASQNFSTTVESVDTVATSFAPLRAYTGGQTYNWRVSVLDAAGHVLATAPVQSFTAQTAPATPTATATVAGTGIDVGWTAPAANGSPLTGYTLRYRAVGASAWTEVDRPADNASYKLEGLSPGQSYEAQVAARNAVGTGPFSNLVTRAAPPLPKAPTNLVLTPGDRGFGAAWTAPAVGANELPIDRYVVRVTPSAGGGSSETEVTTTSATVSDLADATGYAVEVAAVNGMGRGPFAAGTVTTLAAPGIPDTAISAGPAAAVRTGSVSFTFAGSPPANVAGLECQLDGAAYSACSSPLALTGVPEGAHTFSVRAYDGRGRRDATPATRAFTVDLTAPDTTIVSGPSGETADTTAAFTYATVGDGAGTQFECKLDAGSFAGCAPTGKSYFGLAAGAHTFAVRAIDAAGNADDTPATQQWTVVSATATPGPGGESPTATPTPTPTPGDTPPAAKCRVPKLKGKTRAGAKSALKAAHCALGAVKGRKRGRVKSQTLKPGAMRPAGAKVGITLK